MERGNIATRRLDRYAGIPLVFFLGGVNRVRRLAFPACFAPERDGKTGLRVGILCLGAIGDLLLATCLFEGLRGQLPDASIEIVTSKANAAACGLLPPGYTTASIGVGNVPALVRHVRDAKYDLLIDSGQWPRISALVSAVSGAGFTVGFATKGQYRHYAYDLAVPHRNDRHEVENFLALGRALFDGFEGSPVIAVPEKASADCPTLPENKVVFCHMWPSGLHSRLKEWPREYWAELASRLMEHGYSPVFTGGPANAEATESFLAASVVSGALSVAGKISLADLAFHMRKASAVVSVNTGTMHLAALAGAPTIGLHGPTNPLRWGPWGNKTLSLLPDKGACAYLNLGFEYPPDLESAGEVGEGLRHLPVSKVLAALREFGVQV